jgi:hypothetical protein
MELVVSGWGRDHGEKVIARRDLTEARSFSFRSYARPEVYLTTTEGRETSPFGVRAIENGNVELRFYAKITLNGEYLVRQTLTRKEVVRLFLSQYDGCSFQELLDVINEVKEIKLDRDVPPVMLKRVQDIGLSEETVAWLKKNSILEVGDLVQKTEPELRSLPYFNHNAFFEIRDRLAPLGLQFGMQVPGWPAGVPRLLFRTLDEFHLSIRTAHCLKNNDIVYLGDLVKRTDAEMLRTPNFGRKSLNEIKEVLAPLGLHLGMEFPNWRSPGA